MWILKLLGLGGVLLLLGLAALSVREFWRELDDFRPARGPLPSSPEDLASGFRRVEIPLSAGPGRLAGLYRAPENGKLIIFLHGTDSNRLALMPEARLLAQQGFGALSLDLPGHGESDGRVQWGGAERAAVSDAVSWVLAQSAGEAVKVALYGFSQGSMVAVQVAARDPRVQAVALAGAFPTVRTAFGGQTGGRGIVALAAWLAAARSQGADVWTEQPIDLIGSIAPRPILFISGTSDRSVPAFLSDELFDAAGLPKRRTVIVGAAHGRYLEVGKSQFVEEVSNFFGKI